MYSQKAIRSSAVMVLTITFSSQVVPAQSVGSESEVWLTKGSVDKTAYLEGFCQGLSAFGGTPTYNKMGEQTCTAVTVKEPAGTLKEPLVFRFCGKVWSDNAKSAIQFLDNFYRDKNHSDLPVWAAVAAHNDQACNEQTVKGRLPSIQAKGLCWRQGVNMAGAGVSKPVLEKQKAECDKL